MNWFKHKTKSRRDPKLVAVLDMYGSEGYGWYWIILETIAEQMDHSGTTSIDYPVKEWANILRMRCCRVEKIFTCYPFTELFQVNLHGTKLNIDCPNLLKIKDEYSQKSGQYPDTIKRKIQSKIQIQKKNPPTPQTGECESIVEKYNQICVPAGLPRCMVLSKPRLSHLNARNAEHPAFDWPAFFRRVAVSDYLCARIPGKTWAADFEWIIKPENFLKINEGKYDNRVVLKPKDPNAFDIDEANRVMDREAQRTREYLASIGAGVAGGEIVGKVGEK